MPFEIWKKDAIGGHHGKPERTHYTIDASILSAEELSVGNNKSQVWEDDPKNPYSGKMVDIDVPNMIAVIERDKQSVVRGWGIGGKWHPIKDCKRCNNTGQDNNSWGRMCAACSGCSYRPQV
jgi:hypothetical protein